ncbi:hypothetical protein Micbo1qcDRAFT_180263 [Microdochium bolleyi]|uniref:Chitin-binding type-2 domain-containing protein n=1 Tax=Microdochium bolleyi TaxID=196109 RepID=A0A136IM60_9PEZI|nr:hypothetical protein Micbo1qcDRAFT_180263 [Microdochium bolleyi]
MQIVTTLLIVAATATAAVMPKISVPDCVVPGEPCDYKTKQLTCSGGRDKVYTCNAGTSLWEFLWDCSYPSYCVENSSFCMMDFPPPPVAEWGRKPGAKEAKDDKKKD